MNTRRNFKSYFAPETDDAGRNISWSSIIAGVVTFIAFLIMFSLIGTAIGLGVTDATSNDPFAGVGTGLAIWGILSLLISLLGSWSCCWYYSSQSRIDSRIFNLGHQRNCSFCFVDLHDD